MDRKVNMRLGTLALVACPLVWGCDRPESLACATKTQVQPAAYYAKPSEAPENTNRGQGLSRPTLYAPSVRIPAVGPPRGNRSASRIASSTSKGLRRLPPVTKRTMTEVPHQADRQPAPTIDTHAVQVTDPHGSTDAKTRAATQKVKSMEPLRDAARALRQAATGTIGKARHNVKLFRSGQIETATPRLRPLPQPRARNRSLSTGVSNDTDQVPPTVEEEKASEDSGTLPPQQKHSHSSRPTSPSRARQQKESRLERLPAPQKPALQLSKKALAGSTSDAKPKSALPPAQNQASRTASTSLWYANATGPQLPPRGATTRQEKNTSMSDATYRSREMSAPYLTASEYPQSRGTKQTTGLRPAREAIKSEVPVPSPSNGPYAANKPRPRPAMYHPAYGHRHRITHADTPSEKLTVVGQARQRLARAKAGKVPAHVPTQTKLNTSPPATTTDNVDEPHTLDRTTNRTGRRELKWPYVTKPNPQLRNLLTESRPNSDATPELLMAFEVARSKIEQGIAFGQRREYFAARTELINGLRSLSQALDASHGDQQHDAALSRGLRALQEADDFYRGGAKAAVDLTAIVDLHQTDVLHNQNLAARSPLAAAEQYHRYAVQQLDIEAGGLELAADALYRMGKLFGAAENEFAPSPTFVRKKAIVFHRAALAVEQSHFLAANELGVLLVKSGKLADARQAFLDSLKANPHAAAWHNLAVVHQKMGEPDLARKARYEWHLLRKSVAIEEEDQPSLIWIAPDAFRKPGSQTGLERAPANTTKPAVPTYKTDHWPFDKATP